MNQKKENKGKSLRISGKDLGQLALQDFCPRCFWVQRHAPKGIPFQIFPGIFSSIDSYTKRVVHQHFDIHSRAPEWLAPLGELTGYREPPHHSKFKAIHTVTGILLTGSVDAIFEKQDGSLAIADYKTAKFTGTQDALLPMYKVQLNSYAYIARALGWPAVSSLALIYAEPETGSEHAHPSRSIRQAGYSMGFAAKILPIELDLEMIDPLLARVYELSMTEQAPDGRKGCGDCAKLSGILEILE